MKVAIEVQGELKLNADGKKLRRLPLRVRGNLLYDEKTLTSPSADQQLARTARHYRQAEATIRIGQQELTPRLREDRRTILVHHSNGKATLFSPHGPLTRDELDLIDVQANSVLLEGLLPQKPVSVGEQWQVEQPLLAAMLGLDLLHQTDIQCTLHSVQEQTATVYLSGSGEGTAGGVSSEIELNAKYNFDLQQGRITWLALAIKENRSIGHADPGLEVVARLRMAIQRAPESAALSDKALTDLPQAADGTGTLLSLRASQARIHLLHDRRWRAMIDRHDVTILRLIDQGELVAQANLSKLPDMPAGQHLSLEAFQADIRRSLGENFHQFVEAAQTATDSGLRMLRVVAAGTASELPIQWTYYHLSNDQGQRVALVFTLEEKFVERFAQNDRMLASSLQFLQTESQPEPKAASRVTP